MPRRTPARGASTDRSLRATFDPRANALNLIRFTMASGVIVWHAVVLSGRDIEFEPLRQLLGEIFVDGFFAISGFLIVGAWQRDPTWWRYLVARALRIYPAFWASLAVTAFVIAPLAVAGATGMWPWQTLGVENVTYVLKNASLYMLQDGIAGTPVGVPDAGVWNGSLWTLAWEFMCYLAVLGLGLLGLLDRRFTAIALFGGAVALSAALMVAGIVDGPLPDVARFGTMFMAGAVVLRYQDRIRATWPIVAGAAAVTLLTMALPDYRILGALPLAIALLSAGALLKHPRLRMPNDLSYGVYVYAFPLQQALVLAGVGEWGVAAFAALSFLCTLPLAAASWFWLEKPMQHLRPRPPRVEVHTPLMDAETPGGPAR